jgi:hypothetical protein
LTWLIDIPKSPGLKAEKKHNETVYLSQVFMIFTRSLLHGRERKQEDVKEQTKNVK